jgi:hypothetical protein
VHDCTKATDPNSCYTQPFVRYQLTQRGAAWITDAEQSWTILPMPNGNIEGAKALAAEQWLDPIVNAWSKPYVASVARSELTARPLGGSYEIQFNLGPEVVLERIQRVQLLAGASYWVSQGQSSEPPPAVVPGTSPASLPLTGWWRDYAGVPWHGSASAGMSGGRNLDSAGSNPAIGATINGHGPAAFNGSVPNVLGSGSVPIADVFGTTAGSFFALFRATSAPAPGAATYQDGNLFGDHYNGEVGFGFSTSGITFVMYDGGDYVERAIPCGAGAWHLAQWKWDGVNTYGRVDGAAWTAWGGGTWVPSDVTVITNRLLTGAGYGNGVTFDGSILEIGVSNTALSDATFDAIRSYVNARYALSL